MKTLLRSTFVCKPDDDTEKLFQNYQALNASRLTFEGNAENIIWRFIQEFVRAYNHVPTYETIRSHFVGSGETDVSDQLDTLVPLPLYTEGDFKTRLEEKAKARRQRMTTRLLQEAGTILQTGATFKSADGKMEKELKGPVDAIRHVLDNSLDIVAPTMGGRLSGSVTKDGSDFKERYQKIKSDPLSGVGQHTGNTQMDNVFNGAKKAEMWLHAAFTGGMKTTFGLNWAYNQAIHYGHDCLFVSLEMPYEQLRNILYAMHSQHEKFKAVRHQLGLQKDPHGSIGLPYENIKYSSLDEWHPNAEKFLFDYVVPDFNGEIVVEGIDPSTGSDWLPPQSYGEVMFEVPDPDNPDFTVADLRQIAERKFSQTPFASLFVDHAGLMTSRRWISNTTERLNSVLRDLKQMAMGFNRGLGMAMVVFFQINRDGYKTAMKRKDKTGSARYDLTALSYANEAERCVSEGTRVKTHRGLLPIEDVIPGDHVWSSTGWRKVLAKFDNGLRETFKITTDRGSELVSTAPHRVRVVLDGEMDWRSVRELQVDDQVVGLYGPDPVKHRVKLPPLQIGKGEKGSGHREVPLVPPDRATPYLAYLMGAWDGDGKKHRGGVAWTGNRLEVTVRGVLEQEFQDTFGHPLSHYESPSRPGSFDLVKWSQPLKRWFELVVGPRAQQIPEFVWRSDSLVQQAYIRGLIDTDGWVNKQGTVGINMKATSTELLQEVQLLLQGLGIDSTVAPRRQRYKYQGETKVYPGVVLWIRGRESRELFAKHIGFTEPAKQARLLRHLNRSRASNRRGTTQSYQVPRTFLEAFRQVHPRGSSRDSRVPCSVYDLPRRVEQEGKVSRQGIEWVLKIAGWKGIRSDSLSFLSRLLDWQVMSVKRIESVGERFVWDLEVEGDHEYQTGPILSHNSSDIVTASWIDDDLRKENRVQFQCLKSRDAAPFEMFLARVEWPCRRILACMDVTMTTAQKEAVGDEIDKAEQQLD